MLKKFTKKMRKMRKGKKYKTNKPKKKPTISGFITMINNFMSYIKLDRTDKRLSYEFCKFTTTVYTNEINGEQCDVNNFINKIDMFINIIKDILLYYEKDTKSKTGGSYRGFLHTGRHPRLRRSYSNNGNNSNNSNSNVNNYSRDLNETCTQVIVPPNKPWYRRGEIFKTSFIMDYTKTSYCSEAKKRIEEFLEILNEFKFNINQYFTPTYEVPYELFNVLLNALLMFKTQFIEALKSNSSIKLKPIKSLNKIFKPKSNTWTNLMRKNPKRKGFKRPKTKKKLLKPKKFTQSTFV